MKQGIKTTLMLVLAQVVMNSSWLHAETLTTLSKNDPLPMYTTLDPETFLYTRTKLWMKGMPHPLGCYERFGISLSPFGQFADRGRDKCGNDVELGDINGRWFMIGLLMGAVPQGASLPPYLANAFANLFPNNTPGTVNSETLVDPARGFGYFAIPMKYRKYGFRWQFDFYLGGGFGLTHQGGVADICHKTCNHCIQQILDCPPCASANICTAANPVSQPTCQNQPKVCPRYINLTCNPLPNSTPQTCSTIDTCTFKAPPDAFPTVNCANVNRYLMFEVDNITKEIGLCTENFHKVSLEDLRLNLWWRQAYEVNRDRVSWPHFLIMPFFFVGGSVATGKEKRPNEVFGLPFGNNGHHSVYGTVGINLDFIDTIEIGGQGGFTHFFRRSFCNYPVPTSMFQSGIYPFKTDVSIQPGMNWYFSAKLAAYHFLERLSFHFQYIFMHHEEDDIDLCSCDSAFTTKPLEDRSDFKVQVGNAALNYDISPNLGLGFLWQIPLAQRNAFKSSTIMFTFYATF